MTKIFDSYEQPAAKTGSTDSPIIMRRCGIEVRIYHSLDKGRYHRFSVGYYEHGKRVLRPFSKLESAKKHAQSVLQRLVLGLPEERVLQGAECLEYQRAKQLLSPRDMPLDVAMAEYTHILKLLNGAATPTEAIHGYLRRVASQPKPKAVAEVVAELIAVRRAQNSSPRHVKDLESRLKRFKEAFACNITSLTAEDINKWLMSLGLSPRSINNFRGVVSNLFAFAVQQKYVERDANPMEDVREVVEPQKKVGIYTAAELSSLLTSCDKDFLPFLALGAFGGLRSSEIERLTWANIGENEIEVPPSGHRVKSTRLMRMHPTLKLWTNVLRKKDGPVVDFKNVSNKIHAVTVAAGVKPVQNGLRHSFASYWLAITGNPEAVAYHMGNSKTMLNKHYRRLIGASQAEAWFGLTPEAIDYPQDSPITEEAAPSPA